MSTPAPVDLDEVLADSRKVETALRDAVRQALLRHKQAGNPVVVWRNGKVEIVPPEGLEIGAESGA
jgi:hypothetical protein